MDFPILSLLIALPVVFAIGIIAIGRHHLTIAKWIGLIGAGLNFLVSILLYLQFDNTTASMQFVEKVAWIPSFGIEYFVGIDGLSMPLILLTTAITFITILSAWKSINDRTAHYFACFLLMEACLMGVFTALDAILFYVFWESLLIPMLLIIGVWGGERRVYAALKFFLFTFAGSIFMLAAFIYLYLNNHTFSVLDFHDLPLDLTEQSWIFWAFFAAFAVKIPMIPVHTWLPDAHVEAPTGGSVILAAILLKMGGYAFVRFSLPITPDAVQLFDEVMIVLSLVAIVYIGLVALVQQDMKKLIAYSSISHMGFVTLGIFLVFPLAERSLSDAVFAVEGAFVQMISHGFISAALFLCIGVLYDRLKTRQIDQYGGLAVVMPSFTFFAVLFSMANAGLPGTSGFVGEFMIILSAMKSHFVYALVAASTLIIGAAYSLWLVKRIFYGRPEKTTVLSMQDINGHEKIILSTLAVLVVCLGLWPDPLIDIMHVSMEHLVSQATVSKIP